MASTIAKTPTGIRKLNTKIYDDNGRFAVQLYATVVYEETRDTITLRTGGWPTRTTLSRIVQALRYRGHDDIRVNICKGEMVWQAGAGNVHPFVNGKAVIRLVRS